MTCRHGPYDPNCSSYASSIIRLKADYEKQIASEMTPDKDRFEIEDAHEDGDYLVLMARYPNCVKCSYEGVKVMVFIATMRDAMKWKSIDPHFRSDEPVAREAPSPIARFPGTAAGWADALEYVKARKMR